MIIHADKFSRQGSNYSYIHAHVCSLASQTPFCKQRGKGGPDGILPPVVLPDPFPLLRTGLWPHETSTYYLLLPLLLDPSEYSHVQRPVSLHHHTANMHNLIRSGGRELTSSFITMNKSKLCRSLLYLAIAHPWMT